MKFLFLDFDGVLNSTTWKANVKLVDPSIRLWNMLDVRAVERLNRVVSATGAEVVVSSSWRTSKNTNTPEKLTVLLQTFGFDYHVYSLTPRDYICEWHHGTCSQGHRGGEIGKWLEAHSYANTGIPIESFAIVDDDGDMEPFLDHFVGTDHDWGLQDEHVDRLISLLGRR